MNKVRTKMHVTYAWHFSHKVVIKLNRILHNGHIKISISAQHRKYLSKIKRMNISINDILIMKELQKHPRKALGGTWMFKLKEYMTYTLIFMKQWSSTKQPNQPAKTIRHLIQFYATQEAACSKEKKIKDQMLRIQI